VQGNAFSVGGSSFTVSGGSGTMAYQFNVGTSIGGTSSGWSVSITSTTPFIQICKSGTCVGLWQQIPGTTGKTLTNGGCDPSCPTCFVGSTAYTQLPDGLDQDCNGVLDDGYSACTYTAIYGAVGKWGCDADGNFTSSGIYRYTSVSTCIPTPSGTSAGCASSCVDGGGFTQGWSINAGMASSALSNNGGYNWGTVVSCGTNHCPSFASTYASCCGGGGWPVYWRSGTTLVSCSWTGTGGYK